MGKSKLHFLTRCVAGKFDVLRLLTLGCITVGVATHPEVFAQPIEDEFLDFDRPESWAMKYYASVGLMNG
ncbi:MAG: hypothetical protein O7C75_04520, partial [Verrucomicrobia bacterium]|nr:hypothetical protein [Verrucomicrobiota bacterium]